MSAALNGSGEGGSERTKLEGFSNYQLYYSGIIALIIIIIIPTPISHMLYSNHCLQFHQLTPVPPPLPPVLHPRPLPPPLPANQYGVIKPGEDSCCQWISFWFPGSPPVRHVILHSPRSPRSLFILYKLFQKTYSPFRNCKAQPNV